MRLLQPSSNLQLSRKNPDRFLKRGLEIVRKGWGQPSIFNADMVVEELLRQGKSHRGRARRRHFRLRRDRRVRQGSLHPDGLLQPAQGARNRAEQRPRSAHRQADRHRDRRSAPLPNLRRMCSPHFAGSCTISSTSRSAATTSSSASTRDYMPAPFLSLLVEDCIAKGQGLQRRRPALQFHLHHGGCPGHLHR